MTLPDELLVKPLTGPLRAAVRVPGSKSYSNRALPIAAVARGRSVLTGLLESEDTAVMIESLRRLGVALEADWENHIATLDGCGGSFPADTADLFLENSGTSIRFLAALVATGRGTYRLDGGARMRERPIGDLLAALVELGVDARAEAGNGCPPVLIRAGGMAGGSVRVRGDVSSQFLSALLMAAPLASGEVTIFVDGPLVSRPYVDMTIGTMAAFGATVHREGDAIFRIPGGQGYAAREYAIEPDASAASYFFGAAAIARGTITVHGLGSKSLQGDLGFVRLLERMGCRTEMTEQATTVTGGPLRGIDADLGDLSDTVPTLAAVACFADSPTTIRGVAHIRHKETDRIRAVANELRKTGIAIDERADGFVITPRPMSGARMETYNDHRMAMSLALLGLRVPGIVIRDPGCTRKTYPAFFRDLDRLTGA